MARRVLELCLYSVVLVVMAIQYIVPTVENAMVPLSEMDMPRIVERILKLSIPNMYLWYESWPSGGRVAAVCARVCVCDKGMMRDLAPLRCSCLAC